MDKLIDRFDRKIDGLTPLTINPEHGRMIDYLRLSVTDRCNLRCIYCMPKVGIETLAHQDILTFEELISLTKIFVKLGIKKVRLTGGEPLVRKGIAGLIKSLNEIKGVEEILLTTNGILLSQYARHLKDAGLERINISLDTLEKEKFKIITGQDLLPHVLGGIKEAKSLGFYPLKLNVVVMKGINDDEIIDFVEFANSSGLILRFIEFMDVTPLWREERFIPIEEVREICERKFKLYRLEEDLGSGPAQYYKIREGGFLGFIKTDKENCLCCSRIRLTSTGELKICLYQEDGLSLRELLRSGVGEDEIARIIKERLGIKKEVDYSSWEAAKFYMYSLGG